MDVHVSAYIFIFLQGFLLKYKFLTAFFSQDLYEEVINVHFFNFLGLEQELRVKGRTASGGYCDHTDKSSWYLNEGTGCRTG